MYEIIKVGKKAKKQPWTNLNNNNNQKLLVIDIAITNIAEAIKAPAILFFRGNFCETTAITIIVIAIPTVPKDIAKLVSIGVILKVLDKDGRIGCKQYSPPKTAILPLNIAQTARQYFFVPFSI